MAHLSHQQINALRQQDEIRRRVAEGCRLIRAEILSSYDPSRGIYYYSHNKSNLSEAEILRRCGVNKNTIKKPYHKRTRRAITRLSLWAKSKFAATDAHDRSKKSSRSELRLAWAERDDIAEKLAVVEYLLQQSEEENRELKRLLSLQNAATNLNRKR